MRIDANVQINIPVNSSGKNEAKLFSDLKPGDSVNGKVLSVNGNEVIIKTDDGSILKAEFNSDTPVKAGDTLHLMLTSNNEKTIDLKLVAVNNQPLGLNVSLTEATLLRMGVDPSKTNVRLSQILQNNGFLPTEKNIANLAKIATAFPDLDAKLASFMASNDIAPTEKNINALTQIIQNPKNFSQELQALTQFAKANLDPNTQGLAANNKLFSNSFISGLFASGKNTQTAEQIVSQPNFMTFLEDLQGMSKSDAKAAIKSFVNNSNIPNKQEAIALLTSIFTEDKGVQEALKNFTLIEKQTTDTSAKTLQSLVAENKPNGETGATQTKNAPELATKGTNEVNVKTDNLGANGTKGEVAKAEGKVLQSQQSVSTPSEKSVLNNPSLVSSANIPLDTDSPLTAAVKLLGAINKLFAPLGTQAAGQEIQENIKDQLNLLSSIKGNTAKLSGESNTMTARADSALSQAVVANNFDNFYYCQIPFSYNDNKNSAELFVFEKNKGKEDLNDKTNVTVLIALETQNMGRVETVLRSENNILNLEIRVRDEKIKKFIQDNANELKEELAEANFDAREIKVEILSEITTPLNAQKVVNPKQKIVLSGIDIQV